MQMAGEQEQQMFYIIFGQLSQPVWQHFLGWVFYGILQALRA